MAWLGAVSAAKLSDVLVERERCQPRTAGWWLILWLTEVSITR